LDRRTAYNFINVYETFAERANLAQIDIATSALYLLAAPSTPQNVRNEFMQRAKGETVTHKSLRRVIEEEKLQPPAEKSEPPKLFTSKPEVVTIIPKAAVEVETPVVAVQAPSQSAFHPIATPVISSRVGIYSEATFLFCGDTASPKFVERTPLPLRSRLPLDDWDHDWLIERAKTVIIFPEPT